MPYEELDDATYMLYAARYAWEREHPAWETEMYLSGLTPEEYDAAIDKARGATNGNGVRQTSDLRVA